MIKTVTYSTQIRNVKANMNLVAYDCGYTYSFIHTNIFLWDKIMDKKMLTVAQDNDARAGSTVYAQMIEFKYLGYLHLRQIY